MQSASITSLRLRRGASNVVAMRRDGSLAQDLNIACWMSSSNPHGEYRGSRDGFAVVTPTTVLWAGTNDWIVRDEDGTFYPCGGLEARLLQTDPHSQGA